MANLTQELWGGQRAKEELEEGRALVASGQE